MASHGNNNNTTSGEFHEVLKFSIPPGTSRRSFLEHLKNHCSLAKGKNFQIGKNGNPRLVLQRRPGVSYYIRRKNGEIHPEPQLLPDAPYHSKTGEHLVLQLHPGESFQLSYPFTITKYDQFKQWQSSVLNISIIVKTGGNGFNTRDLQKNEHSIITQMLQSLLKKHELKANKVLVHRVESKKRDVKTITIYLEFDNIHKAKEAADNLCFDGETIIVKGELKGHIYFHQMNKEGSLVPPPKNRRKKCDFRIKKITYDGFDEIRIENDGTYGRSDKTSPIKLENDTTQDDSTQDNSTQDNSTQDNSTEEDFDSWITYIL